MLKKIKILAASLFLSATSFSQVNIVSNPSFDNNTACPTITGQYHLCINWLNCNGNIGPGLWGTPDYYHACGIFNATYNPIPPNTALGFCNTRSGGGMMGLVCYNTPYPNYREYLSSNLICPMQPGNTYTVSFWINAGTSPKVKYNTSHFGVYLSNTMPVQTGFNPILVTPQYEITTVVNNTTWTQHTFTINPSTTCNWITLGCFRTDASITAVLATPSAGNPYSNYFVDDISVIGPGNIPATLSSQSVTCGFTNNGTASITPTTAGSYTYNWQPGNQSTQSISNLTAGIYTVTISNSCGTDTKTVSVGQQPSPTVSVNSTTACAGAAINVTATTNGGTPGYTYAWSQGASTSSVVNVNASNSIITCTVTDSQGCKANTSATITVNNLAVSNFLFSLNTCKGILTTTNTSTGASQYQWYFGDGNTSTQASPSYTYSTAGNYVISLVANPGGMCKDSVSQNITVSNPSQSIYSFTNVSCDSTVLLSNSSVGATTYLWNFGDGNTSTLANPGSHGYTTAGVYTITLITNPGSVCADTMKQVVSVSKNVISQFTGLSSPCNLSVSTINTSSFATTYAWNFGDGFSSTSVTPSHNYNSTGTYTISLIANPGTSCADTSYQTVTVNGAPVALFSYIKDICSANVTFTNNSINANSYQWYFGNLGSSTETNPVFNFNKPGTYTVILIANPGSPCADTSAQTIVVNYMNVVADFNYYNPQYTNDVQFTNLSQNAIKYDWIFGDGTAAENVFEPSHSYSNMGEFTVCLRATNFYGCSEIKCKKIKVDSDWTLYVPDAFTPNADGVNDTFFAKGSNINKFKMAIYDRWGEKIFTSGDIYTAWDGKYKGKLVQEDVYVWVIDFVDVHSQSHQKTGHVTVIK